MHTTSSSYCLAVYKLPQNNVVYQQPSLNVDVHVWLLLDDNAYGQFSLGADAMHRGPPLNEIACLCHQAATTCAQCQASATYVHLKQ